MQNNQIVITGDSVRAAARKNDQGIVDALLLSDAEWTELCQQNVGSTTAKLVKCGFCWTDHHETQWMRTFTRMGGRVISHQPSENRPDHAYAPVETAEHRAHNNRAFLIGEVEGYKPRKEAWAPNKKTRADVLLTGTLEVAYEHQHSPFGQGEYSAPNRTRRAQAVGRTVMWHATARAVRAQVPMLRTDGGLPPQVIENLNHRLEFRGGLYRIEIYTCTVRDGHRCPNRKFSGCGQAHARGQVTAGELDDVLRGGPIGLYMPVTGADVIGAPRNFWTDHRSYAAYQEYAGGSPLLGGGPVRQEKSRPGARRGHSRVAPPALPAEVAAPRLSIAPPPTPKFMRYRCNSGVTPCGAPARLYACGWRCDDHNPTAMRRQEGA